MMAKSCGMVVLELCEEGKERGEDKERRVEREEEGERKGGRRGGQGGRGSRKCMEENWFHLVIGTIPCIAVVGS